MFPTAKKNRVFVDSKELQIEHHFVSGLYAKRMIIKAGGSVDTHKHKFDHMSILAHGVALVTVDGNKISYAAPTVIEIKAEKAHKIAAITECHWYCIHATDVVDPELIDETLVMEE